MTATIEEKYDLTLRKIPLTELIFRTAAKNRISDTLIRKQLAAFLKCDIVSISQLEKLKKSTPRKIGGRYIKNINAFFTAALGEEIRIETMQTGEGLFATN